MRSKLYSIAAALFFFGCLAIAFHLMKSAKSEQFKESDFEGSAADQPDAALRYEIARTMDPVTRDVPI